MLSPQLRPLIFLGVAAVAPAALRAQAPAIAPIHASTKVWQDNSVTTTVINPDTGTAEETLRDAGGKLLKRTVYSIDARGQSTGATYYDAKGNIRYRETYTRDSYNRIVESRLVSAENAPLGKRVFVFDSKGKSRVEDYDASGRLLTPPAQKSSSSSKKSSR
jgi:hypothetical protein